MPTVFATLKNCHPERSKTIRESNRFAQSKDPSPLIAACAFAGNVNDGFRGRQMPRLARNDSYNDKGLVGTAEAVPFPSLILLKADG
jgi:hypothetical protein